MTSTSVNEDDKHVLTKMASTRFNEDDKHMF